MNITRGEQTDRSRSIGMMTGWLAVVVLLWARRAQAAHVFVGADPVSHEVSQQ